MKTNRIVLLFLFVCMTGRLFAGNGNIETSNRYICESLTKAGNSEDPSVILNCADDMRRIAKFCPENWLAPYYKCLYELRYALHREAAYVSNMLEDVYLTLPVLEQMKGADLSEVYTLEGLYKSIYLGYHRDDMCRENYDKVIALFDKALELNSSNPRAMMLKFIFRYHEGQKLGDTIENETARIDEITTSLHAAQQTLPAPSWGKEVWKTLMNK